MIWLIRCSNPRKVLRTVPGRDLARKKCELSLVPYFLLNPEEIQYFWIYTHTEACIFLASINTQCYSRQDNNAEVATALRARDLRLGVEFFRLMDWAPQQVPPLLRALISSCTHQMCEPDGLSYPLSPISPPTYFFVNVWNLLRGSYFYHLSQHITLKRPKWPSWKVLQEMLGKEGETGIPGLLLAASQPSPQEAKTLVTNWFRRFQGKHSIKCTLVVLCVCFNFIFMIWLQGRRQAVVRRVPA